MFLSVGMETPASLIPKAVLRAAANVRNDRPVVFGMPGTVVSVPVSPMLRN
jgi:hypothetical protein